jgi:XTP/dITP diphosphohydrolase
MARLVLVRQGSGSPDVLPLEAWHALYAAPVFAAPGDELAARLRDLGVAVTDVAAAEHAALKAEPVAPSGKAELRFLAHVHERTSPGAAALAGELARLANEKQEIAFLLPRAQQDADAIVRAALERAMQGDVEIEVVIGRAPAGHRLLDLVATMHRLRAPGGCPWDREQTHESLAKYLLDETYELLEAIEGGTREHLAEELGDLLLQVVFHAEIADESHAFDVNDVAQGLVTKLVTRHPHVFGDVEVEGAHEVVANWEVIKDHEKGRTSVLEGVPEALPALAYTQKLLKRAAKASLPPEPKEHEHAPADEDAFGELLMAVVASAREAGVDAEAALRRQAKRFRDRIARVEQLAAERGVALPALGDDDLAKLWDETA